LYTLDTSIVEALMLKYGEDNVILSPPVISLDLCDWIICALLKGNGVTRVLEKIPIKRQDL
jgi:hypothetical protein